MLADEPFSDRPGNASRVVGAFRRTYNDGLDDERRQDLYPLASLIGGTAGSRALERERASRCLEFAQSLGARPPAGRAAIGIATPEASGSFAALAALRTGPTREVHARTLRFAHELVTGYARTGRRRRSQRWFGCDPARAVEDALAAGEATELAGARR